MNHERAIRCGRLLALAACLALAIPHAGAQSGGDNRVPGQILLELVPSADIESVLNRYELTVVDQIPRWRVLVVQVAEGDDVDKRVKEMKWDPDVRSAEPHRVLDTPEGGQRSLADLDAAATAMSFRNQDPSTIIGLPAAHTRYTGRGVTVAVVDSGIALGHPEIAVQVIDAGDFVGSNGTADVSLNGVDDDHDGQIDESSNHGTHVAGLVNLAAPEARILAIRVLEADGAGTVFGIVNGMLRAVDLGADVINLSSTMIHDSKFIERAIENAEDLGIVVVVAAGNRGLPQVDFPAYLPEAVAVAAVDRNLVRADFSNHGPEILLSAPGVDMLSTYLSEAFATWSGTSFAAPLVSGAVALLLEKYPGLSPAEIRALLNATAQPDNNGPELQGLMGGGVLDADALTQVLTTDRQSVKLEASPDGTMLRWSPVKDATVYDVARGDVANLGFIPAGLEDDVTLGPLTCIADDLAATDTEGFADPQTPQPGQVFFYVFRDDAPDGGGGSYGVDSDDQWRVALESDCSPNG